MKISFLPIRPSINRAHRARMQIRLTNAWLVYSLFFTLLSAAEEPTPAAVTENALSPEIPVATNDVSIGHRHRPDVHSPTRRILKPMNGSYAIRTQPHGSPRHS